MGIKKFGKLKGGSKLEDRIAPATLGGDFAEGADMIMPTEEENINSLDEIFPTPPEDGIEGGTIPVDAGSGDTGGADNANSGEFDGGVPLGGVIMDGTIVEGSAEDLGLDEAMPTGDNATIGGVVMDGKVVKE